VQKEVARFQQKSATALRLAKRALQARTDADFEARLREVERPYLDDLMKTPDAVEGMKVFLEKRAPVWQR
jgi:enoyl-CoA hydratase/carnithine racemase